MYIDSQITELIIQNFLNQDPLIPRSRNSDIYNLIPNPNRTSRYLNTLKKFINWQSVTNPSKQYKLEHLYN